MNLLPWLLPATIGALLGLGVYLLVRGLVPAEPDAQRVIARMSGADRPVDVADDEAPSGSVRVGTWLQRRIPRDVLARVMPSNADLELVGRHPTTVMGEKVLAAVGAMLVGPLLALLNAMLGLGLPGSIPVGLMLVFTVGAFFLPDIEIRTKAKAARAEFGRAVTAYLELIAVERISGSGATQAVEGAARVAKSWPFERITQVLNQARWAGISSWQALDELATELDAPELHDVADIMRMAGSEDASVYDQLRARARSLRSSQLALEQQRAAEDSNRMTFPVTCTAFVFLGMLLYPMITQAFG